VERSIDNLPVDMRRVISAKENDQSNQGSQSVAHLKTCLQINFVSSVQARRA